MSSCLLTVQTCATLSEADVVSSESKASFSARLVATAFDVLVLIVILAALLLLGVAGLQPLLVLADDWRLALRQLTAVPLLLFFSFYLLNCAYYTMMHGFNGRTLGKALMGIRVVSDAGKPFGLGRSFLRWTAYHLSALPLFIGFLWALFDCDNRAWHDILSGSKVVNDDTF